MSRNKYPEQTREQILDTATRLFLQQGYEHTTIQNIIDQLGGLTKGAVYHHFSSKEAILNAVAARIFENNSLSATWQKIAVSTTLTGSQKLTQMLLAAITDPQEAQFRKLGVQLRNSPQMLRDLLYRRRNCAYRLFAGGRSGHCRRFAASGRTDSLCRSGGAACQSLAKPAGIC